MTIFLAGLRESLPPPVRDRLRYAADRLLPYRQRLWELNSQYRVLQAANAEQEQRLLWLDEQNRTLQVTNAEQEQCLLRLVQDNAQLTQRSEELAAVKLAHQARLAQLEAQVDVLTTTAVERETQLQKKAALDYQLLMIHQQLLAEFADAEPQFREIFERCRPFTMTSIERLYSLYKSIEYLAAAEIPGDFVECGVWRGGSCMLMAVALLRLEKPDRQIVMFDTFEGHPEPDPERDVDLWGNRAHEEWRSQTREGTVPGWGRAPLDEVIGNLQSTGYPEALLQFVKGMVEDTASRNIPHRLALLRLDTDWYASTWAALTHLYPRLVSGGVLILDDYGHYQGQRQAVDEYFRGIGEHPLFHRIDYSCRVAVKR